MSDLIVAAPIPVIGAALALGLCIGSFLNVVIFRLPEMMRRSWLRECAEYFDEREVTFDRHKATPPEGHFDLARPASHCTACQHRIRPWENIPVISYLALRGRCSACHAAISPRYPGIELLTGLLSAVVVWQMGVSSATALALLATWMLVALSFIDIDHHLLPDNLTLPLLWLGLLANSMGLFVPLFDAVWGAAAGYLALWGVYWGFKLLTGKEGMGHGDFKLLAALGAWMGWQSLPIIILLSALSGIAISLSQMLFSGRDRHQPIPFGPYLAVAGWIALLWGDAIVRGYWSYSGL